jgi:hypothetical protein
MLPIDHDHRFRLRDGVLRQEVSGSFVLLNIENGRYYSLNEVGARVFELCDGTRTISDIAAIIAGEYDAPKIAIHADVLNMFRELSDESLLVHVDSAR